jgi:hypothetical protein
LRKYSRKALFELSHSAKNNGNGKNQTTLFQTSDSSALRYHDGTCPGGKCRKVILDRLNLLLKMKMKEQVPIAQNTIGRFPIYKYISMRYHAATDDIKLHSGQQVRPTVRLICSWFPYSYLGKAETVKISAGIE